MIDCLSVMDTLPNGQGIFNCPAALRTGLTYIKFYHFIDDGNDGTCHAECRPTVYMHPDGKSGQVLLIHIISLISFE